MKQRLVIAACAFILGSCATIEVDKQVKPNRGAGKTGEKEREALLIPIDAPPAPVIIERPVYVPREVKPAAPLTGTRAVEQSNKEGILPPQDYSAAAMLYDYHGDFVYQVYCRRYRVTDIWLKPGEIMSEAPFISDSERWMLGAGVSYEKGKAVQHVYAKPTIDGITASLIINTNDRVYHLILKSHPEVHMPIVRWRYFDRELPQSYVRSNIQALSENAGEIESSALADPRFLSFNYRITYGRFRKPRWLPTLAYDDGRKTYVTFPEQTLVAEVPAVFENRADVVNYRLARNVIIIDKLVERITVKMGNRQVVIEKKRGKR